MNEESSYLTVLEWKQDDKDYVVSTEGKHNTDNSCHSATVLLEANCSFGPEDSDE